MAASKTGRSMAPVPSCMPCMSFLAFEAFCLIRGERRRDQKMETRHLHRFMSFLWNHDSAFGATRTALFVSLTRDLINLTGSNRNVNLK